MWKIFSSTALIGLVGAGEVVAQAVPTDVVNGTPVIVPSTSSFYNQQGFNLPTAPRASGQDTIRGAGGISCQSSVSSNGPTFDMGVIGTSDMYSRNSTAVYGRLTVQLGKKPERVDCSHLYSLEMERLKMELRLMRAGVVGANGVNQQQNLQPLLAEAERRDAQSETSRANAHRRPATQQRFAQTQPSIILPNRANPRPQEPAHMRPRERYPSQNYSTQHYPIRKHHSQQYAPRHNAPVSSAPVNKAGVVLGHAYLPTTPNMATRLGPVRQPWR